MNATTNLPASVLTKKQVKTYGPVLFTEDGEKYRITATVRYDDSCGNGHNSFAITADIQHRINPGHWVDDRGGMCHDDIAKHFPELAPLLKWHLCSSDGPLHYVANTVYHASDSDKGKQRCDRAGRPMWQLESRPGSCLACQTERPAPVVLHYQPVIEEGKDRDLAAARDCAIWPEATDEQLLADKAVLTAALLARLPGLLAEFKAAVESLGMVY